MSDLPVRLYVAPLRGGGADKIRLLGTHSYTSGTTLFKNLPHDFRISSFVCVDEPADADFFLVPQAIKVLSPEVHTYLLSVRAEAERYKKQIIVFLKGDYSHRVHLDDPTCIVFKGSEYTDNIRSNETVFAPFVEDLGLDHGVSFRSKHNKPTVSFCGYAGFRSWRPYIKYMLSNLTLDLLGKPAYKRGIYYRTRSMKVLESDQRILTHFVVRTFFSGNVTTAGESPEKLRREYIDSIVESDFVLCPKGDGNYSSRFYETLSLGRIPVLIDTDMVLPLEQHIDYSSIVVRVPYSDIGSIGDYILRFYNSLSEEEFKRRQEEARRIFREYLRFDSYFNHALPLLKKKGIEALR